MTKAQKLETILAKVKDGKRLTKAEEGFVASTKEESRWLPSLDAVAAHYGIARQSLDAWREKDTEGALTKGPKGYDLDAIGKLRRRFVAEGKNPRLLAGDIENAGGDEEIDIAALKARKIRLECDKLSTQIDILRGKYALVDDVMSSLMPIVYAIKDRFLKLGPEISYQLSGMEPGDIEDRIRAEVEKILNKLADDDIPRLADELGKPKDIGDEAGRMPAARETNGRQKA